MNYYHHNRHEVTAFLPVDTRDFRVLEVGCGAGQFAENLKEFREYWGVEPSPDAGKVAADKLDNVIVATYERAHESLPDAYFDCVICNDVIEHIADTDWFLRNVGTKMRRNGLLVGSVPNVRYWSNLTRLLIRKEWEYVDEGILDRTHLRFFTQKSLVRTLQAHGFVIDRVAGINELKVSAASSADLARTSIAKLFSTVAGRDIMYMQFGFRAVRSLAR